MGLPQDLSFCGGLFHTSFRPLAVVVAIRA